MHWEAKKDSYYRMMMLELTAAQLRRAADLKEQLEAAQTELASLLAGECSCDGPCAPAAPSVASGQKLHWTQTPEGKARMDKIRRARWDKRRA